MNHFRHELKYAVTAAEIPLLQERIKRIMHIDPYASPSGSYSIRSLYFDDFDNHCFLANENGTDPREKFRIRIYNHSPEHISLECKRKERGKTLKTACPVSKEDTLSLMNGRRLPIHSVSLSLLNKLHLQQSTMLLRPAVIVEYDRIPYIYPDGNVRITFDMNVASSNSFQSFLEDSIPKRPVMPYGLHLLEVKFDEFLPDFIYQSLNLGTLQQITYSKYYLCRRFALKGDLP